MITDNFSIGLRWSKLFGTSEYEYLLNLYNISFDSNENISYNFNNTESFSNNQEYSSQKYNFELRYNLKKYEFVFSYSHTSPLEISFTPFFDTLGSLNTEEYLVNDNLFERDFGLKYQLNNNIGLVFENHYYNSFNTYDFLNILNNNIDNIKSNHIGAYFVDYKKSNSEINKSIFKFGFFDKKYDLTGYNISDKGFTLGYGINYFKTKNFLDVSFKFGKKSFSNNIYNDEDYYDIKGKSITKSLMKTPINGARLSSSFGMTKHPILGYNKMHRGTDFAAPSGTPIMASGSGTVTRARWCGGGGNCVKIKHNSTYETIYAHMKAFAKGIKEGKKVKQGQIIGYVGSTGMSTGPHLHYEVVVNGKKVNSQKLKLPSGKILKGAARKEFEIERIKIDLRLSEKR